jgi:signal transduction histidine kinase
MRGPDAQCVKAERVSSVFAEQVAVASNAAARAERERLARDLHDSVTQTLFSLQMTAQAAAEAWDTQPARSRAALDSVLDLATAAATEMRALLVDLHDAVLEQRGLVAALEVHCAVIRQRSGLHVELRIAATDAGVLAGRPGTGAWLPAAHEVALYYIVREALANVVKHARASRATVTLDLAATVRLQVEDDGVGFGAQTPAFAYGLAGMRERVGELDGRLHLDNRPTGGARLVVELPLPEATPACA